MSTLEQKLEALIAPSVRSLGYELINVEYQARSPVGGPLIRLFIDFPENSGEKHIGLNDCTAVDHGLDSLFEQSEFDVLMPKGFTLEVSSPGLDRPLKKASDYEKFTGKKAVVKTYRALTEEELANSAYFVHHKKQKNFIGTLKGMKGEAVLMESDNALIQIPLAMISKANLDLASD